MTPGGQEAHHEEFNKLIAEIRDGLAPLTRNARNLNPYELVTPGEPYLVFEIVDRKPNDPRKTPFFAPFVYHKKWDRLDLEHLVHNRAFFSNRVTQQGRVEFDKRVEELSQIENDPTPEKILSGLKSFIEKYEKSDVSSDYRASGVMWQAWQDMKLLYPNIKKYIWPLHLEFNLDAIKQGELIKRLEQGFGYTDLPSSSQDRTWQDWAEVSLVHRMRLDESQETGDISGHWLMVHYPIIIKNFFFVGFAYFLYPVPDWNDVPPLADRSQYLKCLFELTRQKDIIENFLKLRALGTLEEDQPHGFPHFGKVAYHRVVQKYFACFEVVLMPAGDEYKGRVIVSANEVAVCMPASWAEKSPASDAALDVRAVAREYIAAKLEELADEMHQRDHGVLGREFSLCFGGCAVKYVTHTSNPARELSQQYCQVFADERIQVDEKASHFKAQVEKLNDYIEEHDCVSTLRRRVKDPGFLDGLSNYIEEYKPDVPAISKEEGVDLYFHWTLFYRRALEFLQKLAGNTGAPRLYDDGLEELRNIIVTTEAPVFACFKRLASESGLKARNGPTMEGLEGIQLFLPIHILLEDGLKELLKAVKALRKGNATEFEYLAGAIEIEGQSPPAGCSARLYDNYVIVRYRGRCLEQLELDRMGVSGTWAANTLASNGISVLGSYYYLTRIDSGWHAADLTMKRDGIYRTGLSLAHIGVCEAIKELVKGNERTYNHYHVFRFPAWRVD